MLAAKVVLAGAPRARAANSVLVIASLFLTIVIIATPVSAQSARGAVSRMKAAQAAQKKQTVAMLKAELSAAQTALSQAESQLSTSSAALQSAKSQLESAKEREDAAEKESHEAAKALHELEEKLVAAQGSETPIGKAQANLEAAQLHLDEEVHRILSLPAHPARTTESERANERLHLAPEQKSRLKADADYVKAADKADAARKYLADTRRQLLEGNADWKAAHEARHGMVEDLRALSDNRKAAAAEVAINLRHVKAAQEVALNAQQVIVASSSQLMALGEKPPTAPAPKK